MTFHEKSVNLKTSSDIYKLRIKSHSASYLVQEAHHVKKCTNRMARPMFSKMTMQITIVLGP